MNADLTGTVRIMGEPDSSIPVDIYVEDEELRLVSRQGELGRWRVADIGIAPKPDGFHLRLEGEVLVVSTSDDAAFGLALGLRSSSSPRLSRLLAGARDRGLERKGSPGPPAYRQPASGRGAVLAGGAGLLDRIGPVPAGLWGAAAADVLAALVVLATNSGARLIGIPAWLGWVAAAGAVAAGAYGIRNEARNGRRLVAGGVVIGVLTVAFSLNGIGEPTFSWISDGVLFGGSGTLLAGLLLGVMALTEDH